MKWVLSLLVFHCSFAIAMPSAVEVSFRNGEKRVEIIFEQKGKMYSSKIFLPSHGTLKAKQSGRSVEIIQKELEGLKVGEVRPECVRNHIIFVVKEGSKISSYATCIGARNHQANRITKLFNAVVAALLP